MTFRSTLLAAIGILALGATSAAAQGMGLAGIHDWVNVGKKVCMKDHFHHGSSMGMANRKTAEREAITSWQSFTAWEYGGAWGGFRMAESKSVKCSGADANRSWGCQVSARPCRRR